jgi:hypothetical protein
MEMIVLSDPLFELGRIVATPGALDALEKNNDTAMRYVMCHVMGNWGDLPQEDIDTNMMSISEGERVMSSYRLVDKTWIWVITESDRSCTTVLLPEEY